MFQKRLNPVSPGQSKEGATPDSPVVLDGITAQEFETLLWVFYNPYVQYNVYSTQGANNFIHFILGSIPYMMRTSRLGKRFFTYRTNSSLKRWRSWRYVNYIWRRNYLSWRRWLYISIIKSTKGIWSHFSLSWCPEIPYFPSKNPRSLARSRRF